MPFLELEDSPDLADNPRELQGTLNIGSGSHSDWRIQKRDLAAHHFRLDFADGVARVVPASTQNVVVLNSRQVPPDGADVNPGDVVAAGSARFVFLAARDAARPAPAGEPVQALLIDPATKKAYVLRKRMVQIGREIGCNIVLMDPTVSRFHADVRSEAGGYVLYSMGSAGTKVNGQVITAPRMLDEGDQVALGATTLTFLRGSIPPGLSAVQFEDYADDSFSRKHTVLAQRAITETHGALPGRRRGRDITAWVRPLIVGVGTVVVLATLYLALTR